MNDNLPNRSISADWNSKNLLSKLLSSDAPEKIVPEIPAQAIYLTIKQNGLKDSLELLEICTNEQRQLLLDLDLWTKDSFSEEAFWEWLELPDASQDTDILKLIISSCDLKLVANLISRYVVVQINTEPTEEAPAAYYITPDKGYTWIHVNIPESHRNFLLNRFLAAIFDTSPELFYQLISIPNIATASQLEEESFQEKQKRLFSEGFPDHDLAWEINSPLDFKPTTDEQKSNYQYSENVKSVPANFINSQNLEPLASLWSELNNTEELDAELTLILNSAFLRWEVRLAEQDEINFISQQVKGAINIGLEKVLKVSNLELSAIYERYTLQKLYRFGLAEIFKLKKLAEEIDKEKLQAMSKSDPTSFACISGILDNFPKLAHSAEDPQSKELITDYLPFQYLADLEKTL